MKNRKIFLISVVSVLLLIGIAYAMFFSNKKIESQKEENKKVESVVENKSKTASPISNAKSRVTKKSFGTKVSPTDSTVSPEKFTGIHTALDFETTADEKNKEMEVFAFCDGKILRKENARGYGGMIVQSCNLKGEAVTVLYGHVQIKESSFEIGDEIKVGEKLTVLSPEFSEESGGERKHLHFGIHKGETVDTRGYVATSELLREWIDPIDLI